MVVLEVIRSSVLPFPKLFLLQTLLLRLTTPSKTRAKFFEAKYAYLSFYAPRQLTLLRKVTLQGNLLFLLSDVPMAPNNEFIKVENRIRALPHLIPKTVLRFCVTLSIFSLLATGGVLRQRRWSLWQDPSFLVGR